MLAAHYRVAMPRHDPLHAAPCAASRNATASDPHTYARNRTRSALTRRGRRGQLLVECLMSMLLVSITSLILVSTSASFATLGDDAMQIARAQRAQGNAAGRALLAPCDSALASVTVTRWPSARLRLDETLDVVGALHRSRTDARWTPSALAATAGRVLQVSSAARCR
jgi:hypothetical protein